MNFHDQLDVDPRREDDASIPDVILKNEGSMVKLVET